LLPPDITYKKWKETFVDNENQLGLKNVPSNGKIEISKSARELVKEKQEKVNTFKTEYASLEEINNRFYMSSSDFSTPEEELA